jgi:poly(3-hydroxybutyrate) depolymerase
VLPQSRHLLRCASTALALLAACALSPAASTELPRLGVALEGTTVSGVSSGGYMAVQFHVAYSAIVRGAGVIAGGPYYCAQGSVTTALVNCMQPTRLQPVPDPRLLAAQVRTFAAARRIDAPEHLAGSRAWLFSGTRDATVDRKVVAGLERFYRLYLPARAIVFQDKLPAGHAMITLDAGKACPTTEPPFINDCDFDAAGQLLVHLAGPLQPPAATDERRLVRFQQREFTGGPPDAISMAAEGFAYVPAACERGGCRVHVVFHGCRQGVDAVGEQFVREAGYNRWAEANGLVVLYPQVAPSYGWGGGLLSPQLVFNPRGCWDWWGYTGPLYPTQAGPQMRAVRAMLDRLATPVKGPDRRSPEGAEPAGTPETSPVPTPDRAPHSGRH